MVFFKPFSLKWKLFSNPFLVLYISLILLPQIIILLLWFILDTYTHSTRKFTLDHQTLVMERCDSSHTPVWVLLLLSYLLLVMVALVVLAFKSSKIRYMNFKDTNATNALTFLAVFFTFSTLIYWFFFRNFLNVEETFSATVKLSSIVIVVNVTFVLLCPTLLFLPKICKPINRHCKFFGQNVFAVI